MGSLSATKRFLVFALGKTKKVQLFTLHVYIIVLHVRFLIKCMLWSAELLFLCKHTHNNNIIHNI